MVHAFTDDSVVEQKICIASTSLGTVRTVRPLTRTSEESLVYLLKRMQHFYAVHGINLRTTYEDFDKHHMGIITESQVCTASWSFYIL